MKIKSFFSEGQSLTLFQIRHFVFDAVLSQIADND